MKFIISALSLTLAALPAFASTPSAETQQITRALVNNPDIVSQLKSHGSDHLADVRVTEVKHGINKYELTFDRQCNCIPLTAIVTIVEDLTPTYVDGAPKYTSSIKVKTN